MSELHSTSSTLLEKLAAINADDLPGLADLHSSFEAVLQAATGNAEVAEPTLESIKGDVERGRSLLEALILNEVENVEAQIESVKQCADELAIHVGVKEGDLPPAPADEGSADELFELPGDNVAEPAPEPVAEVPASAPAAGDDGEGVEPMAISEDDLPLVEEFIGEGTSHLEQAEQDLLTLEENPADEEAIGSLFRAFHTLKGVAGFLNLAQVQNLAHATENLLDRARAGKLELTGDATKLTLRALDKMKVLVAEVEQAASKKREIEPITGVKRLCTVLHDYLEAKDAGKPFTLPEDEAIVTDEDDDDRRGGEDRRQGDRRGGSSSSGSVKVGTKRLDKLIDMVGELVIANSMVHRDLAESETGNTRLARNMGQLGKIVRELQDLSMSLRMIEVGTVFRKMSRVVRDTAAKINKDVELIITGGETELDRTFVDALHDPLIHMVRNSVDHGLESPDEREKVGKPRKGQVELRAFHKGGDIHIQIIDDGKGLNAQKILARAHEKGIVREDEVLPESEVFKLIFAPGFSTAEKVTEFSGRGVGMDVVRRNLEALRGRVEIQSTQGKGSTFTIRLPLTLAVIDGLVVMVGTQKYILPIASIEQSLRPTKEMLSSVQGRGEMCMVRGELLPIVRLHRLFGVEPRSTDPTQALVVIVQDGADRCCILVDELLGQEQVVIKSLGMHGETCEDTRGLSGGAVLGDGNVSLILDVPGLLEISQQ